MQAAPTQSCPFLLLQGQGIHSLQKFASLLLSPRLLWRLWEVLSSPMCLPIPAVELGTGFSFWGPTVRGF